jgi:hypothetical protein
LKTIGKTKRARVSKRNLFGEFREGMTALAEAQRGKRTLRTHAVEFKPAPKDSTSPTKKNSSQFSSKRWRRMTSSSSM